MIKQKCQTEMKPKKDNHAIFSLRKLNLSLVGYYILIVAILCSADTLNAQLSGTAGINSRTIVNGRRVYLLTPSTALQNYTIQGAVTNLKFTVVGGGASGAPGTNGGKCGAGGGGGYVLNANSNGFNCTASTTLTVTIGAGGTGVASGDASTAGTQSELSIYGSTYIAAGGGATATNTGGASGYTPLTYNAASNPLWSGTLVPYTGNNTASTGNPRTDPGGSGAGGQGGGGATAAPFNGGNGGLSIAGVDNSGPFSGGGGGGENDATGVTGTNGGGIAGAGGNGTANATTAAGQSGAVVVSFDGYDLYLNNTLKWIDGEPAASNNLRKIIAAGTYTLTGNVNWGEDPVTIENGAAIDLNGFNLTCGALTINGTGTINGSGNVDATFNTSGGTVPATTFRNLSITHSSGSSTLGGNVSVTGTLTITNTPATLVIGANTLTVNGFSGNGSLTGSSTSVVVYGGGTATMKMDQTSDLSTNRLKYLKLNSGASLTLGNKLVIYGGSGNTGGDVELASTSVLTTGGFLTLKHNGTSSGHSIIGGLSSTSLSGTVSVEDYFAGGVKAWRQTGSVLSGGLPVDQITDDFDLYATNPGVTDANGFLLSSAGFTNPSLLIYNESSSPKWVPITMSNSVQTLDPGEGFSFFMRPKGSGAAGNWNEQYFDYAGEVNKVDFQVTGLTHSGSSISSTNGFNLLANPYLAYLDLNQFFINNSHLEPVIYKLNKLTRSHESYATKNGVTPGNGVLWRKQSSNNDLDGLLDPGDAFFVKLKNTNDKFADFKLSQLTTVSGTKINGLGQNKMEIDSISYASLVVTMRFFNDSVNADAVKLVNISCGGDYLANTDKGDVYDMRSTCNELSLVSVNSEMLAVKTLNSNKNWIIPVNVSTCSKGKCYFDFNIDYNKPGMESTFELYDKYLKKNFTIVSGSRYEFEVSDIPQSFGADRFYINLNNASLGMSDEDILGSFDLYPNPVSKTSKINVRLNSVEPGVIEIKNMMGQEVSKKSFDAGSGQLNIDLERFNLLPGTYFIVCKQKSVTTTKRLTVF